MLTKFFLFILLALPLASFCQKKNGKVIRTYSYSGYYHHKNGHGDFYIDVPAVKFYSEGYYTGDAIGPFPIKRWGPVHYSYTPFSISGSYSGYYPKRSNGTRYYRSYKGNNLYIHRKGQTIYIGKGVLN